MRSPIQKPRKNLSSTDVLIAENPATDRREEIVNAAIEQGSIEIALEGGIIGKSKLCHSEVFRGV